MEHMRSHFGLAGRRCSSTSSVSRHVQISTRPRLIPNPEGQIGGKTVLKPEIKCLGTERNKEAAVFEDEWSNQTVETWAWTGSDEYSHLGDRLSDDPLPLPRLSSQELEGLEGGMLQFVLVRHGQSTWNARNRVQGSSNFSVLTERGIQQAEAASNLLGQGMFDRLYVSPLKRARETADIILEGMGNGVKELRERLTILPSLREIDLYSFQGLDKYSKKAESSRAYAEWKKNPSEFEIDGHSPVKELWYRSSLAWQKMIEDAVNGSLDHSEGSKTLVVAHNAVNQALICTSLGLPAACFRRITQSNAASSKLRFQWKRAHERPDIVVEHLNFFPASSIFEKEISARKSPVDKLILICSQGNSETLSDQAPLISNALHFLRDTCGVDTAPLIAIVGSPEAQASDVLTALKTTIEGNQGKQGTRLFLALTTPKACDIIIKRCLDIESTGNENSITFEASEGSLSVLSFKKQTIKHYHGTIVCTNYNMNKS